MEDKVANLEETLDNLVAMVEKRSSTGMPDKSMTVFTRRQSAYFEFYFEMRILN